MPEATIASFILRFTQEQASDSSAAEKRWRGVVRHVQTNEEARFTQLEDALAFIAHHATLSGIEGVMMKEENSNRSDWTRIHTDQHG
jgi:hypothetical protein